MIKSGVHFIDILNSGVDPGVEDKRKKEAIENFRYVTTMANRTIYGWISSSGRSCMEFCTGRGTSYIASSCK